MAGVQLIEGFERGRSIAWEIDAYDVSATVGDNKAAFPVPSWMNGWKVTDALVRVKDKGVTGSLDVSMRRIRNATAVDVLSTPVTVGDEYFAADGVVNAANAGLLVGDLLVPDVDAVHSTASKGLWVVVTVSP